ncbi:MAG: NAD(P)-dependent oxidoreductase [Acidobacteriia bacterium]|nr:NAD(P)-dependent oxidoreductase [Terriglobia bacterium]
MNSFAASHTRLSFIGIGNMGSRIAQRLLEHGYKLAVYDRDPARAEAMTEHGASVAGSLAELAEHADVILSCLTNDDAVQSVYLGPDGVFAHAPIGTVILEMSTILPQTSRELARDGAGLGLHVLDVAISGSTPAAEQGTLSLLGGGNPDIFWAAHPIFQAIATRYFHLGPSGSGTTMKLVVNSILGVGMQAIAEACALGQKAGLDRDLLLHVLSQTAVVAPAHAGKLSRAARNDYSPQFPLQLMNKDFRLILETASAIDAAMPATQAAFQINSEALPLGAEEDLSAVIRQMEKLARVNPAYEEAS